jgi:hypothetical protein
VGKILRSFAIGSIGLGAALGSAAAHAETLLVTWTESTAGISASWEQTSSPTPTAYVSGTFTQVPVWDFTSTGATPVGPYTDIAWVNGDYAALFFTPDLAYFISGAPGVQTYSGDESAPTFLTGAYYGIDDTTGADTIVTISDVPEISTWAMMALGFAGLGLAGYRASRTRAALEA